MFWEEEEEEEGENWRTQEKLMWTLEQHLEFCTDNNQSSDKLLEQS